nr:hypothetical protein [Xanthomonas translucens]
MRLRGTRIAGIARHPVARLRHVEAAWLLGGEFVEQERGLAVLQPP